MDVEKGKGNLAFFKRDFFQTLDDQKYNQIAATRRGKFNKKPKSGENKLKLCSKGCQRAGKPQSEQGARRRSLATRPSCKFWQNKTASFNQCHIFIFILAPAAKAKYAQRNGFVGHSLVLLARPYALVAKRRSSGSGQDNE